MSEQVDLEDLKAQWLDAIALAERFIDAQDPTEIGCLYYDHAREEFVAPPPKDSAARSTVVPHFGRPGGVLPAIRS
ncbi:MAG: hypothetical protein JRG67_12320 [Deltaproteobacteria bacterium]|nr:hypothetical protein [Deltaproteobacteria bacterium]